MTVLQGQNRGVVMLYWPYVGIARSCCLASLGRCLVRFTTGIGIYF